MAMVVRSNIMANNANRQLSMNNTQVGKSLEKLSSGFRINRAGDDASGLAISEKMKAQIKGLETASANSQDGVSLIQTAEGSLTEVHSMLNRMVELADKAANGTMDANVDRNSLEKEVTALKAEINRIADSTNFNGIKLLDGGLGGYTNTVAGDFTSASISGGKLGAKLGKAVVIDFGTLTASTQPGDLAATGISVGGTALTAGAGHYALSSKSGDGTNGGTLTYNFVVDDKTKLTAEQAEALEGTTLSVKHGAIAGSAHSTVTIANNATGGGLTLQIGDTADSFNQVTVSVADMSTTGLGIASLSVADQDSAAAALSLLKNAAGGGAINTVSGTRADLGALQNRLEHTISNLDVASENMTSANSRIRDTDMAKEMMEYTKMNVLTQAAQAMLAQANQQPQSVLQLLK